jgi:hypothetical protein
MSCEDAKRVQGGYSCHLKNIQLLLLVYISQIYTVHGGKFIRYNSFVRLKTLYADEITVDGYSMDTTYEEHMQ